MDLVKMRSHRSKKSQALVAKSSTDVNGISIDTTQKERSTRPPSSPDTKPTPQKHKKILLKSTPVDEDTNSWSEDSFVSTEVEVLYAEKDEEKDNEITLACIRRIGFKKKLWKTKLGSYSVMLSYLISIDAIISAYTGMRNHGITCIYPLLLCVGCVGFPVVYLELALGQYTSGDPFSIFARMAPVLGGIGYMITILNICLVCYDIKHFAVILKYLWETTAPSLVLITCWNPWNDLSCQFRENTCEQVSKEMGREYVAIQGRCVQARPHVKTLYDDINAVPIRERIPGYHFTISTLLGMNVSGDMIEWPQPELLVYITIAFFIVLQTTRSRRAVVWSTIPLLLLVVFLTSLAMIQQFYPTKFQVPPLTRNNDILSDHLAWGWAIMHTLRLTKIGQGGLLTIGAMHDFHNNILGDALVLCSVGVILPFLLSMAVTIMENQMLTFTVGYSPYAYENHQKEFFSAHENNTLPSWIDSSLGFYYDEQCGALLGTFYLVMMFFVFVASKFVRVESLITSLVENFEVFSLARKVVVARMVVMFIFSMIIGGVLEPQKAVNNYLLMAGASFVVMCEVGGVILVYGPRRFYSNINLMMFGIVRLSKSKIKNKFHQMYNVVNVLITFLLVFVVPPLLCFAMYHSVERTSHVSVAKVIIFVIVITLAVPGFITFKLVSAWYYGMIVSLEFRPVQELWGPREEIDRQKANHEEKQLRT